MLFDLLIISECYSYTPSKRSDECQTLVFSPLVEPYISIMKIVAEQNDLVYGDDIIGYGIIIALPIIRLWWYDDESDLS